MLFVIAIQIIVPLILIGVTAAVHQPSRPRWFVNGLAFGMVIAYLLLSARWDISSVHLRYVIAIAFLAACVVSYRKIRPPEEQPRMIGTLVAWGVSVGLIVLMGGFLFFSIRGYGTPEGAVDLPSPLVGGHIVLNGGNSPFTNGHFRIRPQGYALDIVGLNKLGGRASVGGGQGDLNSYEIYGHPVISPCAGVVAASVDSFPDQTPPAQDSDNPAGNHVLVECVAGFEVLLAHLRPGTALVSVGDTIEVGQAIGEVGNSGNTTEPHLHIHAERGGEPGVILDGEGVPFTIDGRFLVRNSVIR